MNFDRYIHLCNYYYGQGIEYFHHLKKFPCVLLQSLLPPSLPHAHFQATSNLIFVTSFPCSKFSYK